MGWTFGQRPFVIAGPCVVEPGDVLPRVAETLARIGAKRGVPVCFKASFDKANRARGDAPRGPGLDEGLRMLERVRQASGLPVLTDIHDPAQAAPAALVADALQIPAFLCRQTDLLLAAGRTGRPVNVKKGQWLQPEAMGGAVDKVRSAGSADLAVTERGTCARVARGVFGQQAGAAAVAMINNAAAFPPFEGPILSNPDTGVREPRVPRLRELQLRRSPEW